MDISELPVELTCPTLQLVVLLGLDVNNVKGHKDIWDLLVTNRRPDRKPLNYQLATDIQPFASKAKSRSDESKVDGILKSDWMKKHLCEIPAVLVLFVDLDWTHSSWSQKVSECAAKIQIIRQSVRRRNPYFALVLLQSVATLPTDETVTQKATELCAACELSSKLLFILPQSDRLFGYVLRLEHAFYELAQNYYQNELKMAKAKKDSLSRTVSQRLYVRYSFKQGFFSELCQDSIGALRYYKQAYQMLLEIDPSQLMVTELKVVAGFLTYKICNLCFKHSKLIDSISHFRKHIDYFKNKRGICEVEFEHFAWLARQFWVFADLFDAAVQKGLCAVQFQHPGFYYLTAADYTTRRKELGQMSSCIAESDSAEVVWSPVMYYGQRLPTETDHGSLTVYKAALRNYLYRRELTVNHFSIILLLLSNALSQFKKHRSPRMKLVVMMRITEQYFWQEEFELALQVLSHVLCNFRKGRWWSLVSICLSLGLKCAFSLADMKNYVSFVLEAMHPLVRLGEEERDHFEKNLYSILQGDVPEAESDLSAKVVTEALARWRSKLDEKSFLLIPMSEMNSCISLDGHFELAEAPVTSDVLYHIRITLLALEALPLFKLSVVFNNSVYDFSVSLDERPAVPGPDGKVRTVSHSIRLSPSDSDTELKVSAVKLDLSHSHSKVYVSLMWDNFYQRSLSHLQTVYEHCNCRRSDIRSLRILSPPLNVGIELGNTTTNSLRALVEEEYRLVCYVENREEFSISGLRLVLKSAGNNANPDVCKFGSVAGCVNAQDVSISLQPLDHGCKVRTEMMLCFKEQVTDFPVDLILMHSENLDGREKKPVVVVSQRIVFNTDSVFTASSTVCNVLGEKISTLICREECILQVRIRNVSKTHLIIKKTKFCLDKAIRLREMFDGLTAFTTPLLDDDEHVSVAVIMPLLVSASQKFGELILWWQRAASADSGAFKWVVPLPCMPVASSPILVGCAVPAFGVLKQPFPVKFYLENNTEVETTVGLSIDASDRYAFCSGLQTDVVTLPASSCNQVTLSVIPLLTGVINLPQLKISMPNEASDVALRYAQRNVPQRIYVLPNSTEVNDA